MVWVVRVSEPGPVALGIAGILSKCSAERTLGPRSDGITR